ncbi:hypothetical protein OBBRIDRAFT_794287 [Obba rivulosa]|uniref:Uncharacterized protein n=1 Tax=Obba rivulosa TaxID=1052685 RepID=A0A8E2AZG7_9APHY|nr:hypothetical protein OBBRIDRAFT_794287 [Obba rivulosa]
MTDPRLRGYELMVSISAHKRDREESFEEIRVRDYLQAYMSTGKPPDPCPQVPAGARERAAIGLPLLFEPFVATVEASSPFPPVGPVPTVQLNGHTPSQPSDMQVFAPRHFPPEGGAAAWIAQVITFQPQYMGFSLEELRLQAYQKGLKAPVQGPAPTTSPSPTITNNTDSSVTRAVSSEERFQSITASPPFAQHSFEELRLAYHRARRPMTSPEIFRAGWAAVP